MAQFVYDGALLRHDQQQPERQRPDEVFHGLLPGANGMHGRNANRKAVGLQQTALLGARSVNQCADSRSHTYDNVLPWDPCNLVHGDPRRLRAMDGCGAPTR